MLSFKMPTDNRDRRPVLDQGEKSAGPPPEALVRLVQRYPFLRRHPHPMVVHFTIVFLLSTTFFNLLYLLTGTQTFETTAFHCLGAGVLSMPFSILTGFVTRWLNYPGEPTPALVLEARLSWLLLAVSLGAFIWRLLDPAVLSGLGPASLIYLFLIISVTPLVTLISYFGGLLTFPLEED